MSIGASPSFETMSNFPAGFSQGLQVQGMPVLNAYAGRVFWLDSLNGSDGNKGTFAKPFASLAGALRNMVSPAPVVFSDLLMTKPGHQERVSSSTALAITLTGVQIIGLGVGDDRPTFTLDTAASSTITVVASQVSFQNCRFVANFANITRLFTLSFASSTASISGNTMTVTAVGSGTLQPGQTLSSGVAGFIAGTKIVAQVSGTPGGAGVYTVNKSQTVASGTIQAVSRGFNLRGCEIVDNSAVLNFLTIVGATSTVDNSTDGVTILGNNIHLLSAAGACNLYVPAASARRVTIANNFYQSKTTAGGALIPIAAGKSLTASSIVDNIFDTTGAAGTATGLIVTTDQTTNTGVMARNLIRNLATVPILATAASGFIYAENYYASAADKSGALLPVV